MTNLLHVRGKGVASRGPSKLVHFYYAVTSFQNEQVN